MMPAFTFSYSHPLARCTQKSGASARVPRSTPHAPGGQALARAAKRCSERVLGSLAAAPGKKALPELAPPPAVERPIGLAASAALPRRRTPRGTADGAGKATAAAGARKGHRNAEQLNSCDSGGTFCLAAKHSFTCSRVGFSLPTSGVASSSS